MRCCLCASREDVAWCNDCKHYFCLAHREGLGRFKVWNVEFWQRGAAFLKEHLLKHPPDFCLHEAGKEAA